MDLAYIYGGQTATITGTEMTGTKWSNGALKATYVGYGGDYSAPQSTWITVGEVVGSFNPATQKFQYVATGPMIETNKFIDMAATQSGQATLQKLNIPCVEVGSVNLSGSATFIQDTITVNMNNVKFFATQSGAKPALWATNGVSGSYGPFNLPTKGQTVNLTGAGGFSAAFKVQQFQSGGWLATIENGAGGFNGSTSFRGVGAGSVNTGNQTFLGNAAGVAK